MKAVAILFATFVMLGSISSAESLEPEEVVRALVRAAHGNNLQHFLDTTDLVKVATHPRHSRSPVELLQFLKGVDQGKITFQKQTRSGWPDSVVVRMTAPLAIDFELVLIKATIKNQEDHYVVVAAHP